MENASHFAPAKLFEDWGLMGSTLNFLDSNFLRSDPSPPAWSGARVFDWRRWERFGSKKLSQSGIGFLRPINQPPESDSHGSIAYQIQSKNRRSKTNCKFDKSKSAASTKACRAICGVPNRDATDSTSQFSNQSHDNGTHGDESTTCSGK